MALVEAEVLDSRARTLTGNIIGTHGCAGPGLACVMVFTLTCVGQGWSPSDLLATRAQLRRLRMLPLSADGLPQGMTASKTARACACMMLAQ